MNIYKNNINNFPLVHNIAIDAVHILTLLRVHNKKFNLPENILGWIEELYIRQENIVWDIGIKNE